MFGLNNIVDLSVKIGKKLKKTLTNKKKKYTINSDFKEKHQQKVELKKMVIYPEGVPKVEAGYDAVLDGKDTAREIDRTPSLYPHVSRTLNIRRKILPQRNIPYTEDGYPDLDKLRLNNNLNFFEWDARVKAGFGKIDEAFKGHEKKRPIVLEEIKRRADIYRSYAENLMGYQASPVPQQTYSKYSESPTTVDKGYEFFFDEREQVIKERKREPTLAGESKMSNTKANNVKEEKTLTKRPDSTITPQRQSVAKIARKTQNVPQTSMKISRPPRIAACHQTI